MLNLVLKNIFIPVGIFLYIPFCFYIFLIVWGQVIDAKVHWDYVTAEGVSFATISFVIWSLVTWLLGREIVRQYKKDSRFPILAMVPVVFFVGVYCIGFI